MTAHDVHMQVIFVLDIALTVDVMDVSYFNV